MEPVIECQNLLCRYGQFVAAGPLSFSVQGGTVCAVMGPNGAGKSTLLKMLCGLEPPTSGRAKVASCEIGTQGDALKWKLGVLPERLGPFEDLTVAEHLRLTAEVYRVPAAVGRERQAELLGVLGLTRAAGTLASECSQGMRKKTSLAMALLPNPPVLLLDEPFEALDPVSAGTVRDLLAAAASRGTTVLLSSHLLSLVQQLAHQVILMQHGCIVANAPPSDVPGSLEAMYFEHVETAQAEDLPWLGCSPS